MNRRALPGLLVTVALLGACGTTVPLAAQRQAADSGLGPTGSAGNGADAGASAAQTAGQPLDASGAVTGATTSATTGAAGGSDPSAVSVGAPVTAGGGASGRGYDAHSISIGVLTQNDTSTATRALGASGLDFGNYDQMLTAIANDINAHGGMSGRRVTLVKLDIKTLDSLNSAQTTAQTACAYFTQDHKVAAVVNPIGSLDNQVLYTCLSKRDIPLFSLGTGVTTQQSLAAYHGLVLKLLAPEATRWAPLLIQRLAANGWFQPWNPSLQQPGTGKVAVGLLYQDQEPDRSVYKQLQSLIEKRGYKVVAVAYDPNDTSQAETAVQSATLQFQSAGVTHVIPETAGDALLFSKQAASQGYHPRYGLNSTLGPYVLEANSPNELKGMMGISWLPSLDVDAAQDPGPLSPADAACGALMRKAGVDVSPRGADTVSTAFCDAFNLMRLAIAADGPSPSGIVRGLSAAAGRYRPGVTYSGELTIQHPLMPTSVRDLRYDEACSCIKLTSRTNYPL